MSDRTWALLKVPSAGAAQAGRTEAFAHELQLAERLLPDWALCPLQMGSAEVGSFLMFDDCIGAPLDTARFPLEVEPFLVIAMAAAKAVEAMHAQGMLHLDLKPANLFVSDQTSHPVVRLTGFSIATPLEGISQIPGHLLRGTLSYMSPEQTGHLSRRIDTRTDLYSLGIIFYQMLTGSLPFEASDAPGWILCHIAMAPEPPEVRNGRIPPMLSAMVLKLLAKDPDERYRTAAGLGADLERALGEWRKSGQIEPFPLAEADVSDRFHIPQRLYGRDAEIAALRDAYARVAAEERAEFLLLAGYSGTGKTALVEAVLPDVLRDHGFFASGKFDQFKRDIPYSTLIEACHKLLQGILSEGPGALAVWREQLMHALGGQGGVLADVLPQLELVIGKQPPVAELPPQEAQNRFIRAFKNFLGVFARPETPLTLFLDDLHWADAGSLNLLQETFLDPVIPHMLVLGAYRDNEIEPGHPLSNTLMHLGRSGAPLRTIKVEPILPSDVECWIADMLATDMEEARPLAAAVAKKTGCNPFFVTQFLQNLYREHLISLDRAAHRWMWDLPAINARNFTDNVVDFLVGRLEQISPELRAVLPIAAFVGQHSPLATLATLSKRSEQELRAILMEGEQENLLRLSPNAVDFVHDRVQQAAYSLVPPDAVASLHLRIGLLLVEEVPEEEMDEVIFDIANQFRYVSEEMLPADDRRRIALLNLRAGLKAKASAAFQTAIPYFSQTLALLSERRWETDYETTCEAMQQLALCEYYSGNSADALARCNETIDHARTAEDKARIYTTLINILTTRGEMEEAIRRGTEGLALLGMDVGMHPDAATVAGEIALIAKNLVGRPVEAMLELPLMDDPRMLLATEILSELLTPALFFNRPLFRYCCALILNISLKHGIAPGTTWAAALFGALYLVRADVGRYRDGHDFAKVGNDLVERHGFVGNKARVILVFGDAARPFTCPLRSNAPYLKAAFDAAIEYGDLVWGAYACNHKITNMLAIGDPLPRVWEETLWRRKFVQRLGDQNIDDILLSQQGFILSMQGKTDRLGSFDREGFDQAEFERGFATSQMFLMVCWYYIIKGHALYLANRYEEAREALRHVEPLLWTTPTDLQITEYHFYLALTRLALGEPADDLYAQIAVWAENCAENFAQMRDLVAAETARVEGRWIDAEELYERAIGAANASGFVHDEALAYERAALFYRERGLLRFATQYLREACRCYRAWGADGKVRQMEGLFPEIGSSLVPVLEGGSHLDTVALRAEQVDLISVIKASQSISSQILEAPLIDQLLAIVLEGACAQHAYLLLPSNGEDYQVAACMELASGVPTPRREEQAALRARVPDAVVRYVFRTKEVVCIGDASQPGRFSESFAGRADRSVLALPIIKQEHVIAVLYLDNELVTGAFTPDRLAFIQIVAMQSAISLDNARLYEELRNSQELLLESQKIAWLGSWELDVESHRLRWTDEVYRIFGLEPQEFPATYAAFLERVHPDDRAAVDAAYAGSLRDGRDAYKIEHRIVRKDTGEVRVLHEECMHQRNKAGRVVRSVGMVQDITERKQAEIELLEKIHELQRWQTATLGREGRIGELKQEVNELSARLGQPLPYATPESLERKLNR